MRSKLNKFLYCLQVEKGFSQGTTEAYQLDIEEVAEELRGLKLNPIRMAYDVLGEKKALEKVIPLLERVGFRRRRMIIYVLYNWRDSPKEFLVHYDHE